VVVEQIGTSGTSVSLSGTTNGGIITYSTGLGGGSVQPSLVYDGSTLFVTSSINVQVAITLANQNVLPATPVAGQLAVSASAGVHRLYFYNGSTWTQVV